MLVLAMAVFAQAGTVVQAGTMRLMDDDDDDGSVHGVLFGDDEEEPLFEGVQVSFEERRLGGKEEEDLEEVCAALNFEGIPTGTIVYSVTSGFGIEGPAIEGEVKIYAVEKNEDIWTDPNRAMIFNTSNPTGGDDDLETGNAMVPERLEQMLIISEDFDSTDPDDSAKGGHIEFDFSMFGPAGVVNIDTLLIMDNEEGGNARCFDAPNGARVRNADGDFRFNFQGQDGKLTPVDMGIEGCGLLRIRLKGSGAVELPEICIERPRGGGGDPIFKDTHGHRTQFWLPVGYFTQVLSIDGYELFMRVFGKLGSSQQWVDGIAVRKDGRVLFDALLDRSDDELSVVARLDDGAVAVDADNGDERYASTIDDLKVRVNKHDFPILPGVFGDDITIKLPSLVMRFFTMPARKFKDPIKAAAFAHFDFEFLHVAKATEAVVEPANGLLADLYFQTGVAPDAAHAAYLQRPSAADVAALDLDFVQSPDSLKKK